MLLVQVFGVGGGAWGLVAPAQPLVNFYAFRVPKASLLAAVTISSTVVVAGAVIFLPLSCACTEVLKPEHLQCHSA